MRICYVNFNLDNPRDRITLRGLRENGVVVKEISDSASGWRKYWRIARAYRACERECDMVMVGYAGSALVILMRLLTRKKIVYNALSTFYDSMIVSRFGGTLFSPRSAWYYLIDTIAFRSADRVFVECQAQKDLAVRVYGISPKKLSVHFVGADDTEFYFDSTIPKLKQFTVVFRGMFLPEAGADVVLRAAKELEHEDVQFRIIGRGLLKREIEGLANRLKSANVELITEKLPLEALRGKMLECHVSLGQLADHPRVHTTIPHKAFESMAMKLPYLTGENRGVMEILKNGETCFTVPPGDYHALARKIIELRDHPEELKRVAENAYQQFEHTYTPRTLGEKIRGELVSRPRVLYLFSGTRAEDRFAGTPSVEYSDTQFHGLNHLNEFGIDAEYREFSRLFPWKKFHHLLGFRMRHALMYFGTRNYDIVFGSSLYYMMFFQKLFRRRTKFILLNISLTRVIARHQRHWIAKRLLYTLLRELNAVICLSETQKTFLEERVPALRGKVSIVLLGTDTKFYHPHYEGRKAYILAAGRDNGRDYATVLAVARLMPDREFHIICGERNLARDTELPPNVHVFYDVPLTVWNEKFYEAGVLFLSTHADTYGDGSDCSGQIALLQAMACGLPVVATRKEYLREYAIENKDILVAEPYHPEHAVEKIRELDDSARRAVLTSAARARVEQSLSTRHMAERLAAIFSRLCA